MDRNTLEDIVDVGLGALFCVMVVWAIVGIAGLGTALQNRGMTQVPATITDTAMVGTESGGVTTAQVTASLDGEVVNRTVDLAEVHHVGNVVTLDYRPVEVAARQLADPLHGGMFTFMWKFAAWVSVIVAPLLVAGLLADTRLRVRDRRVMA